MSSLDAAAFPKSPKDLARWQKWVEDRLKYLGSSRSLIERGSVAGGVTTIREILTNPAASIPFRNVDAMTASGPGELFFRLTYTPVDGSLHLRWNGVDQPPTEWVLSGRTVTIADPTSLIHDGDVFTAAYAYETTVEVVQRVTIQLVGNSHSNTLALTFILPNGTRYDVPGINTPGAGPVVDFGYFVLEDMGVEFKNLTTGHTWTWPDTSHIHRDPISGSDLAGAYTGYRWSFEDGGDSDFNDIIMDVKAY